MNADIKPDEFDVLLFNANDTNKAAINGKEAAKKLYLNYAQRPKNIIAELNVYRKYVPDLIRYFITITKVNEAATKENERLFEKGKVKHYKRWTPEEDEMLIECVCDGKTSMNEISVIFGRSPAAIQSRITALVGVKRLSQAVAGRFIGKINGVDTRADVDGVIYKKELEAENA